MRDIFLEVMSRSMAAGWLVLAVAVLRVALKRAPKAVTMLLWGMVALRLLCPVSIESRFSLIPEGQAAPWGCWRRKDGTGMRGFHREMGRGMPQGRCRYPGQGTAKPGREVICPEKGSFPQTADMEQTVLTHGEKNGIS